MGNCININTQNTKFTQWFHLLHQRNEDVWWCVKICYNKPHKTFIRNTSEAPLQRHTVFRKTTYEKWILWDWSCKLCFSKNPPKSFLRLVVMNSCDVVFTLRLFHQADLKYWGCPSGFYICPTAPGLKWLNAGQKERTPVSLLDWRELSTDSAPGSVDVNIWPSLIVKSCDSAKPRTETVFSFTSMLQGTNEPEFEKQNSSLSDLARPPPNLFQ